MAEPVGDDLLTAGRATRAGARHGRQPGLRVRGHAALPSGRAALGALLMVIAAVGVLVSYSRVTNVPLTAYVTAARDLEPGTTLRASDVRPSSLRIPASMENRLFRTAGSVEGLVLLAPVAAGELIQRSSITKDFSGNREVSLAVDEAQAAGGRLGPGDRVDVIATFDGDRKATIVVLSDALVVRAERDDGRLSGTGGPMTITLALPDKDAQLPLVEAIHNAKISLVRVTGLGGQV